MRLLARFVVKFPALGAVYLALASLPASATGCLIQRLPTEDPGKVWCPEPQLVPGPAVGAGPPFLYFSRKFGIRFW